VSIKLLENNLKRRWVIRGSIKILDMVDGFLLVYFSSEEDYNHVIYVGPCVEGEIV
jgi:hypothetical protein